MRDSFSHLHTAIIATFRAHTHHTHTSLFQMQSTYDQTLILLDAMVLYIAWGAAARQSDPSRYFLDAAEICD